IRCLSTCSELKSISYVVLHHRQQFCVKASVAERCASSRLYGNKGACIMPAIPIIRSSEPILPIDKYPFYPPESVPCAEETTHPKHRELLLEMASAWTRLVTAEMSKPGNTAHPLCSPVKQNAT